MAKILILECMQEISSFNPRESQFDLFHVERGVELLAHRGRNSAIGGALSVFEAAPGVEVIPVIAARAGSAGPLSAAGWAELSELILSAAAPRIEEADALYVSLHGAMGAVGELDPEGHLLTRLREMAGPSRPIVISLDLHGILTERMIRQVDGLAIYHTYPHVDFADTGARAARLLLDRIKVGRPAAITRTVIPALVRGDELITATGFYGTLLAKIRAMEATGEILAGGIMIGNPFTDVPELCTQVVLVTDAPEAAVPRAEALAEEFWAERARMQGKLIALDRAIAEAKEITGPVVFTDAADATSSGASGDSNAIVKALVAAGYSGRVLAQIVDPAAAAAAHRAGVGAVIDVTLGGKDDPARFTPMPVRARVKLLSDGKTWLETMRSPLDGGPTAVLEFGSVTMVVLSLPAMLFDRALYYSNGLDPKDFDLIVVKSPHTEHHMYDAWVERNFNVDAPGATSADLRSLGHKVCARPIYPLDDDVVFTPATKIYLRGEQS